MNFIYFIIPLIASLFFIIINLKKINKKEHFNQNENNKLLIKKTNNFKKVFSNDKYTIWEPISINNYFPITHYITLDEKKPLTGLLVKNKIGENEDKPMQYIIQSITNDEFGIWKPIPNNNYKSMGYIYSKNYPSKYLIRTIPKKFCQKSNVEVRLIKNKIDNVDKGYEIWSIKDSDSFIINNLNNKKNIENFENINILNNNYLDVEEKLYVKYTHSYKKICSYKDPKNNKEFFVWRPIPVKNFCSLGDIVLNNNTDPNNKLKTIIAHKSMCRTPLNYGSKSIYSLVNNNKTINFWRPKAPDNYYFMSDIVVIGDDEPNSDNLIYCISLDYITKTNKQTQNLVFNNINSNKPLSIWCDSNNFLNINNNYTISNKNKYILEEKFLKSDVDFMDNTQTIVLKFKNNNKIKNELNDENLINLVRNNLSEKLDINTNRIQNLELDKNNNEIKLLFNSRNIDKKELTVREVMQKLNKILNSSDIKIYNKLKNLFYISIDAYFSNKVPNNIVIDNSVFNKKIKENN